MEKHTFNSSDLTFLKNKQYKTKFVKHRPSFYPSITLCDYSFKKKGPEEDRLYEKFPFLIDLVRRGNTYLYSENENKITLVRKGLQKFFDLDKSYIEENLKIPEKERVKRSRIYSSKIKHIIFDEAEKCENAIKIYKSEKVNGENCQIAYNSNFKLWLISSKNVCLCARNKDDLNFYEEINDVRYDYSLLFARKWFEILINMEHKGIDLKQFKKEMENKCLIGEYCGNLDYQHLIMYDEINIRFFAIVDLEDCRSCIPPSKSIEFFEKYKLCMARFKDCGVSYNFYELNDKLYKIYDQTFISNAVEEGEGNVLYFVELDGKGEEKAVLSLCKIKTFEYRALRKLREKLRAFSRFRTDHENKYKILKAYEKELYDLVSNCESDEAYKKLEEYRDLAKYAFSVIEAHFITSGEIYYHFSSLLTFLLYNKRNKLKITDESFTNHKFMNVVKNMKWIDFFEEDCKSRKSTNIEEFEEIKE